MEHTRGGISSEQAVTGNFSMKSVTSETANSYGWLRLAYRWKPIPQIGNRKTTLKDVAIAITKACERLVVLSDGYAQSEEYVLIHSNMCLYMVVDKTLPDQIQLDGYIGFLPQRVSYRPHHRKSLMGGYAARKSKNKIK